MPDVFIKKDVFISYRSVRWRYAHHLCSIIEAYGYSCWYDYYITGNSEFQRQIFDNINAARAVVVLWCSRPCNSDWVYREAAAAKATKRGVDEKDDKYIGVKLEADVRLKVDFANYNFKDFTKWNGDPKSEVIEDLICAIRHKVTGEEIDDNLVIRKDLRNYTRIWRALGEPDPRNLPVDETVNNNRIYEERLDFYREASNSVSKKSSPAQKKISSDKYKREDSVPNRPKHPNIGTDKEETKI